MALAARIDGDGWRTHVPLSDGEHDEGQLWEAVMFAAKYQLHNLTAWIDRNNIQIDGFTEDVMPLEPLATKYASFGWHVLEIDGHNYRAIADAARFRRGRLREANRDHLPHHPRKGSGLHGSRLHLARHPARPGPGPARAGRAAEPARPDRGRARMSSRDPRRTPGLFGEPDQKACRAGFGDALAALGEEDENIVVLTGDLAESTKVDPSATGSPAGSSRPGWPSRT